MSVTFHGKSLHLSGTPPQKGEKIRNFTLIDKKLEPVSLYSLLGDCTLLLTLPSCDTQVCSLEMKTFQQQIEKNKLNLSCIVVSMDLPFAQERWVKQYTCYNISLFSDYRFKECGEYLGLLIQELGLLARACFVINHNQIIHHMQLVPDLSQEPDYQKIFQSITAITKGKSA